MGEREDLEHVVDEALEKAERARKARRYNDGVERLVDALEHGVKTDAIYFRLGNIYYDAGDRGRAEYAWRRAIEINPKHVNAHHNLAALYKQAGRLADSIRLQKRAVRLQTLGRATRSLGRNDPAFPTSAAPPDQEPDLRAPVPEDGEISAGNDEEGRGEDMDLDALKDDPDFRRWSRYIAIQSFFFVAFIGMLVLVVLFLLVVWWQ